MEYGEILDPQAFIDKYGRDAAVRFDNGLETTLGSALDAEAMLCSALPEDRLDTKKRIGFLARLLADGKSLQPEDAHLLPAE